MRSVKYRTVYSVCYESLLVKRPVLRARAENNGLAGNLSHRALAVGHDRMHVTWPSSGQIGDGFKIAPVTGNFGAERLEIHVEPVCQIKSHGKGLAVLIRRLPV